jgi:hypothetical protein
VNLTTPGSYPWTISISDSSLTTSAKYVLRFLTPATSYSPNAVQLSSPGFLVLKASSTSTTAVNSGSATTTGISTSSASSSSSSSSAGTSTTSTTVATPVSSTPGSGSLSSGAKAGIGIGVSLGVLGFAAFIATALVVMKRQKRHNPNNSVAPHAEDISFSKAYSHYDLAPPYPVEVGDGTPVQSRPFELPGTIPRT